MRFSTGSKVYIKRGGYKAESLGSIPDFQKKQKEVIPKLVPFDKDPTVKKLKCDKCGRQIPIFWLTEDQERNWNGICPVCSGYFKQKQQSIRNARRKERIQRLKREKALTDEQRFEERCDRRKNNFDVPFQMQDAKYRALGSFIKYSEFERGYRKLINMGFACIDKGVLVNRSNASNLQVVRFYHHKTNMKLRVIIAYFLK